MRARAAGGIMPPMAAHKSGGMVEHVPDLKRPRGAAALREAVALLRTDVLHHIVTLKMIQVHGADVTCKLVRHGGRWALLTVLPTRVSPWDRETYPSRSPSSSWMATTGTSSARCWRRFRRATSS